MSGTMSSTGYGGPSCAGGVISTLTNTISGARTYSNTTCEVTEGGHLVTVTNGGTTYDGPLSPLTGPGCPTSDAQVTWTCTNTIAQVVGTEDCLPFGGGNSQKAVGTQTYELSDEDTEEDAIERENAPQEWAGSSCLSAPAFRTQRTTGFTFEYNSVQSRVRLTDLLPDHSYDVTTFYYRRLLGSTGPWIFFSLNIQSAFGTGASEQFTSWVDVPNESDFETRAQSCLVEDVTPP